MLKKKNLSNLLTILLLAFFVWYGFAHRDSFAALKYVSVISIILIMIGRLAKNFVTGIFTQWTAEVFTRKFTFRESIYITILSSISNFFGPVFGGASIRAVYFKKVHNLSYSNFTATLLGYYLIEFTVNCGIAIGALLVLKHTNETGSLLTFFFLWLAALIVLMFLRLPKRQRLERFETNRYGKFIVRTLYEIETGWHTIIARKKLLVKLVGLAFVDFGTIVFVSFLEFHTLKIHLSFAGLMLYSAFTVVAMLVSFTPGAIGIRESMLFLVSRTMGVSNVDILQVAVLDRGTSFLYMALLFAFTRNKRTKKFLASENSPV